MKATPIQEEPKFEIVDQFDPKWRIVQAIPSPKAPPSTTVTQVDPEQRYIQLKEELFQLEFRIQDSERREGDITWQVKDLESKIEAKHEALAGLPASDALKKVRERIDREIGELEDKLTDLKPRREAMIRLVGQSKRALRAWQELYGEEFENCKEITKALDRARL